MKAFLLFTCVFISFQAMADSMSDVHKKHRQERHEEKKRWDQILSNCRQKYPKWIESNHPDYDSYFKCSEEVQDLRNAQWERQQDEICEKFNVGCSRRPSSLK